jgi:hypothetical protein
LFQLSNYSRGEKETTAEGINRRRKQHEKAATRETTIKEGRIREGGKAREGSNQRKQE